MAGGLWVGSQTYRPNGDDDIVLTRLDANGDVVWTQEFGSHPGDDALGAVSVDGSGNGYVVWNNAVVKLHKHRPDGELMWSTSFGSPEADARDYDVDADELGSVFISGRMTGDFVEPNLGGLDAYVSKFNSLGILVWTKQFGTAAWESAANVAADGKGGVYFAGRTRGRLADSHLGDY
ncbi:MAG: hypothetical protein AAF961_13980, partial [Planctomycetota bacterium]